MRIMPFLTMILGIMLPASAADLRGHGGPVRAILIDRTGNATTAGFDTTLIRWDVVRGQARQVLRFHEGAVIALAPLPDGGVASAGEDRRIALWTPDGTSPQRILEGHKAPIVSLALSPDGLSLASASWDGTIRLWPLKGGDITVIEGHRGNVNAVLFLPDGTLVSAGYDGTIRFQRGNDAPDIIETGLPINALVRAGDEIIAAGVDGALRFVKRGSQPVMLEIADAPLVALAASPDGKMVAASGFRGALALVDRDTRKITRRMSGPAFPLWSIAFSNDGREILTGGADRLIRHWLAATGEPVNPILAERADPRLISLANHPGAEVFKACSACHSLGEKDDARAGPSLHKLMGRKVGTAPGYSYSPALDGKDIVWTRETVAKLFEIGPNAMLPGTKMPEQTVNRVEDREALVDFLEKATGY